MQLDLFGDYASNVALYPDFQRWLREHRSPRWPFGTATIRFLPAGAAAFRRDVPDVEVHPHEIGHFALEMHAAKIAAAIRNFLARRLGSNVQGRPAHDAPFADLWTVRDGRTAIFRMYTDTAKVLEAVGA